MDISNLYKTGTSSIVTYKRDQYGLRGTYSSPESIDILTVGGSTTEQFYITEGQTWQDVLAKDFLVNGKNVSVVNAGIDGQSTYGHIKNFDWWFPFIPNLKAKYILFYVGLNDFYTDALNRFDDLVDSSSFRATIKDNSALYLLYQTIKGTFEANALAKIGHRSINFAAVVWNITAPNVNNHEALMHNRLQSYADRLRLLGRKVKKLRATPICVTQASRNYKIVNGSVIGRTDFAYEYEGVAINAVDYFHMMQLINKTTTKICTEIGGIPLDLANGIKWDDTDFYDFVHNTPSGAAKIGHYLYDNLLYLF